MTENELRKYVKATYPHIKIKIKTVSFIDLCRDTKKCLTITGDKFWKEVKDINEKADAMGVLIDSNIRCYPMKGEK